MTNLPRIINEVYEKNIDVLI